MSDPTGHDRLPRAGVLDAPQAEQLTLPERLARLDVLLRGQSELCHKINNPLTSVMGRAQMLRLKNDLDPQLAKAVLAIEESAKRVAELVREMAQVIQEGRKLV
jgi:signal transduction histidine kinase